MADLYSVTFPRVSTTPEIFTQWLRGREVDDLEDYHLGRPTVDKSEWDSHGRVYLNQPIVIGAGSPRRPRREWPGFCYTIASLGNDAVEMTIEWFSMAMSTGWEHEVLGAIAERWPETRPYFEQWQRESAAILGEPASEPAGAGDPTGENASRVMPAPPPMNAPHDDWFRWYHIATDDIGYRMTLKDLADKMGLSHNYTRRLHSEYMAQHHTEITQT
ncbi:MAG: hypothetical protein JW850_15820 [Thermoflexales bacterium]|nr:hypothetical protein [Thermoflexales bacterium]